MSRLAIVISAVGSTESLESTLLSVLENRPADSEIVVAIDQPYSDPYELKDEVRFVGPSSAGAMANLNAALGATRAPFVHLLASGCKVTEGWTEEPLARFGDRRVASVVPWVVDADAPDRLLAAGVGYRTSGARYLVAQGLPIDAQIEGATILGPCSFAAFYRKAALEFVGGFSRGLSPRQADVDVAIMLARAGFSTACEPRCRIVAHPSVEHSESAFRQALCNERLFWRNWPASAGRVSTLVAHAALIAWELVGSLPRPRLVAQALGRMLGACQIGDHARHRWALAQLERRALSPQRHAGRHRIDPAHPAPRLELPGTRVPSR